MKKIEFEVEKILKEKGIAPPSMSQQEFMGRLEEKLATALPERFAEAVNQIRKGKPAVVDVRLGRG